MTTDLFDDLPQEPGTEPIAPGAVVLRALARDRDMELLQAVQAITERSPLQHMQTPGGYTMSVASTSCGPLGWVSSPHGYRYASRDPATGQPWPDLPACFSELARLAAQQAGYDHFVPDACLINAYAPGAKLSLHQDRHEEDLRAPIVSVSLGLPAVFVFGGLQRSDPTRRLRLAHGDVVVWGGPARLAFHAVLPLADGTHRLLGRKRINLTLRRVRPM